MSNRHQCALAATLCTLVSLTVPRPATAEDIRAVVEPFTSQGCSSCPPADALLGELAGRPGVLALSNHVDDWDALGWRDPRASTATTERRRSHARAFALRSVSTPPMVLNGAVEMPGTRRDRILSELGRSERPLPVPVTIGTEAGTPIAVVGEPEAAAEPVAGTTAEVWLFVIEARVQTVVPRGENAGRSLDNVNVVRDLRHLGGWRSGRQSVAFAAPTAPKRSCAVIVQAAGSGTILGAAHRDVCGE